MMFHSDVGLPEGGLSLRNSGFAGKESCFFERKDRWCYMVLYGVILGKHNEGELGIEQ